MQGRSNGVVQEAGCTSSSWVLSSVAESTAR